MSHHAAYPGDVAGVESQSGQHLFGFRGTQALLELSAALAVLLLGGLYADVVDQRGAFQQELRVLRQALPQPDVPRECVHLDEVLNPLRVAGVVFYHLLGQLLYHYVTSQFYLVAVFF